MAEKRKAAVSGMFYPSDKKQLQREIDIVLQTAPMLGTQHDEVFGLVVPHAGYAYSGSIAAAAYNYIAGHSYDVIVLLGPTHRVYFEGISVGQFASYETPLGEVPVDLDLANTLIAASDELSFLQQSHLMEHSLEVQLPFLQSILKKGYKIVPLVFGGGSLHSLLHAAETIHRIVSGSGKRALYVCSTDLSHDYPYEKAVQMDGQTADRVAALDYTGLEALFQKGNAEACGGRGLITFLKIAELSGCQKVKITALANSGDVVNDRKSRIVGYMSAVVHAPQREG